MKLTRRGLFAMLPGAAAIARPAATDIAADGVSIHSVTLPRWSGVCQLTEMFQREKDGSITRHRYISGELFETTFNMPVILLPPLPDWVREA